jgi:homoserine dehydrogenase
LKRINLAILGLGNIGTGTYKTLAMNRELILSRTGLDFEVTRILEIDVDRDRGIDIPREIFTQQPGDIFDDPGVDIVIELLGGIEFATDMMLKAIRAGKHVVTANKAAIAANYDELLSAAKENGVLLRFEASVGGGIPILNALTTALIANEYQEIMGILNGTTNYILTKMTQEDLPYDIVLKEAQEKGFAEADPTADVEGEDVANKLSILMSLIFGKRVHPKDIPATGITNITKQDIEEADREGCVIKLIASAFKDDAGEVSYFVQPTYINKNHPLAGVNHEFNAVFVKGNAVGDLMFYGKGAGPLPTGSAVMGDVIEIGRTIGGTK